MKISSLAESDVRAMVRLLGDINAERRLLTDGLSKLVGATAWIWCMAKLDPDKPPSFISLIHSGFEEDRFARCLLAINHPAMEPVMRPSSLELKAKGTHLGISENTVHGYVKYL